MGLRLIMRIARNRSYKLSSTMSSLRTRIWCTHPTAQLGWCRHEQHPEYSNKRDSSMLDVTLGWPFRVIPFAKIIQFTAKWMCKVFISVKALQISASSVISQSSGKYPCKTRTSMTSEWTDEC